MNWVIAFLACFMFQWHNIYFANMVFVIGILYSWMKNGRLCVSKDGMICFLFYFIWVACSVILYLPYKTVDKRNLIQFIYNLQYIFWIVHVKTEKKKLRYAFYVCSKLLAMSIVAAWALNYAGTHDIIYLMVGNRMWGENLFGGWPNGTVLPLLYGLYMEMKYKWQFRSIKIFNCIILYFALLLTTSRTGMLAGLFIITYFIIFRNGFSLRTVAGGCVIVCSVLLFIDVVISSEGTGLIGRMVMTSDRINVYLSSLEYIKMRPISGLGGNTFDYAYETFGSTIAPWNWGHTHNTVFELLIRYGSVGLITFVMYIIYLYKKIRDRDDRFAFILLWGISLMQIFLKDFIFLILIWMLIPDCREERKSVMNRETLRFGGSV